MVDRSEKMKVAVDVALYYFIVTTVLSVLGKIIPNLFLKNVEITKLLGFSLPWFIVSFVVILILSVISNMLKDNMQVQCNANNKILTYLITGILLIGSGVISIPTQIYALRLYLNNILQIENTVSQFNKEMVETGKYTYIVPILCSVIQIGIGLFLAIVNSKMNKKQTGNCLSADE